MKEHENKYYVETVYKTIPIGNNHEIRVVTSEDVRNDSLLVDIRKFSLYGNTFDDIKRPTNKGIKFKLKNINDIICGLLNILVIHGMLNRVDEVRIMQILNKQ